MWSLHAPAVLFNMHGKIVRCKLRTLLGFHGFMFKKYFHEADYCLQMCIVKVWRGLHIIFTLKCKHHCLVQNNVEVDNDDKHIPVCFIQRLKQMHQNHMTEMKYRNWLHNGICFLWSNFGMFWAEFMVIPLLACYCATGSTAPALHSKPAWNLTHLWRQSRTPLKWSFHCAKNLAGLVFFFYLQGVYDYTWQWTILLTFSFLHPSSNTPHNTLEKEEIGKSSSRTELFVH